MDWLLLLGGLGCLVLAGGCAVWALKVEWTGGIGPYINKSRADRAGDLYSVARTGLFLFFGVSLAVGGLAMMVGSVTS